jgi:uncharacterized protein
MAAKFELYKDKRGEYRWRLRYQNGNIIADSGEGYTTKAAAINGIESVKKNAAQANIKEMTSGEPEVKQEAPPAAPAAIKEPTPSQPETKKMAATFEVFEDKKGEFRWRLRHQNGNIIADSGEGYVNKASALNGINSVIDNAPSAPMEDQTA